MTKEKLEAIAADLLAVYKKHGEEPDMYVVARLKSMHHVPAKEMLRIIGEVDPDAGVDRGYKELKATLNVGGVLFVVSTPDEEPTDPVELLHRRAQ